MDDQIISALRLDGFDIGKTRGLAHERDFLVDSARQAIDFFHLLQIEDAVLGVGCLVDQIDHFI